MQSKNYFLIGNSVTRHYGFTLRKLLSENSTLNFNITRLEEKEICREEIGISSCSFPISKKFNTSVTFLWKYWLGEENNVDDFNDFCRYEINLTTCLLHAFSATKKDDVLIIGSIAINGSYFYEKKMKTWESFKNSNFKEASMHLDITTLAKVIFSTFPGVIIWHSYPHMTDGLNNDCYEKADEKAKEIANSNIRGKFVNLRKIQIANAQLYDGIIHHPGILSEMIVLLFLNIIRL